MTATAVELHEHHPLPYPRCEHCAHSWHGLECSVPTSVKATRTCACPSAHPS